MTKEKKDIKEAIQKVLREQWNQQLPADGECADFAQAVVDELGSGEVCWNEDNGHLWDHAAVRFEGRLYDAECLSGVYLFEELPLVQRVLGLHKKGGQE